MTRGRGWCGRGSWIPALALGAVLAPGCEAPKTGETPLPPAGLVPLTQIVQPTEGPHLAEAVVYDERWLYVANSNDVVAVYELGPEGAMTLVNPRIEGLGEVRCTTLAVHQASASLYCGNDDLSVVERYSLSDPKIPARAGSAGSNDDTQWLVRDLEVHGDRLLLASFHRGLHSMAIGEDGALEGELVEAGVAGNMRVLASAGGERVWALTADRGVLMLEHSGGGAFAELGQLPMPGPALDLGLDPRGPLGGGERAAIALGSEGARVVEWDGATLREVAEAHPPGVVSAADLDGEALAAVTLTGAYLYDLRPDAEALVPDRLGGWSSVDPPLAGFLAAGRWETPEREGSMLYARFAGEELLITDWNYIERIGVNLDGYPLGVDIQRAAYHSEDEAWVGVGVRNPGSVAQVVSLIAVGGAALAEVELGPFESRAAWIEASRFELANAELVIAQVRAQGSLVGRTGTVVMRRPSAEGWPVLDYGEPAPGDLFPELTMGRGPASEFEAVAVPSGHPERVVFFGADCVAMWAEVEDLVWRMLEGDLAAPEGSPSVQAGALLAVYSNLISREKTGRWRLDGLPWAYFGPELPEEVAASNPWADAYEEGMHIPELPGAAHHPTDYEIDGEGRVIAVEREYRGTHPLWAASLGPPPSSPP